VTCIDAHPHTQKRRKRRAAPRAPPPALHCSPALSRLLSGTVGLRLSRGEATSRLWGYAKAHNLQDPSNGRVIRCSAPLREVVFKRDAITSYTRAISMSSALPTRTFLLVPGLQPKHFRLFKRRRRLGPTSELYALRAFLWLLIRLLVYS
jgi:hypothetical protein